MNGRGHRKSIEQRQYQKLEEYKERLKAYAKHIEICGEQRNSYSKTDHSATFMRVKSDYMGNGQLLPAYNLQAAICDLTYFVSDGLSRKILISLLNNSYRSQNNFVSNVF